MALVTSIQRNVKERTSVHEPVECRYVAFTEDGNTYLQLDTYGKKDRDIPGKISQSLQFGRRGAQQLLELLVKNFPDLSTS